MSRDELSLAHFAQHVMGVDLYWAILPLAVILLLAVGSDYNLPLISRFEEEIRVGINAGIIRSMRAAARW
jgi:RND superfamily putative drug exporter